MLLPLGARMRMSAAKVELYAAIRRDHRAVLSMRALKRTYGATWRPIRRALDSHRPEPRAQMSCRGLLTEVLLAECDDRARWHSQRPIKTAGFPREKSLRGWRKTSTDPRPCSSTVDRLTFGGNIIETGTDACRLAPTKARAERADAGRTRGYPHRSRVVPP